MRRQHPPSRMRRHAWQPYNKSWPMRSRTAPAPISTCRPPRRGCGRRAGGRRSSNERSDRSPPVAPRRRSQWQQKVSKGFSVKGAKRRLRRLKTLDNKILSKHTAAVAIDGFLRSRGRPDRLLRAVRPASILTPNKFSRFRTANHQRSARRRGRQRPCAIRHRCPFA
jgi:hypothetical protein